MEQEIKEKSVSKSILKAKVNTVAAATIIFTVFITLPLVIIGIDDEPSLRHSGDGIHLLVIYPGGTALSILLNSIGLSACQANSDYYSSCNYGMSQTVFVLISYFLTILMFYLLMRTVRWVLRQNGN